jgi:F-type H+-transporting ATPase subunit b
MHVDRWTLLLQTINFVVLIWLLHRFLYRPVLRLSEARRAQVEHDLAQGRALAAQAQAQMAELQRLRAGIATERDATLQAAAVQAQDAAAKRRVQAEREAQGVLAEARATLANERLEAVRASHEAALQLGTQVALRLLEELPDRQLQEAWLERAAQYLCELPTERLQALRSQLSADTPLEVRTAQALDDVAQRAWVARLRPLLDEQASIGFALDNALVAGVELRFPQARLAFSWQSALAALDEQMQEPRQEPQAHAHTA